MGEAPPPQGVDDMAAANVVMNVTRIVKRVVAFSCMIIKT